MKIVGRYSFNGGLEAVKRKYPRHLEEVECVINSVDDTLCLTKVSKEKTMTGKVLEPIRKVCS